MTQRPPDDERDDPAAEPELPKEVSRALAELDLLVPETPAEVQRAEAAQEGRTTALPAGLRQFRGASAKASTAMADAAPLESGKVLKLPTPAARKGLGARGALLGGGLGVLLGAAAASVYWQARVTEKQVPGFEIGGVGSELRERPAPPQAPLKLELPGCTECCGGSGCTTAKPELATCPSGRTCVACLPGESPSTYRVRISALALSDAGKEWVTKEALSLDNLRLCAALQGRSLGCRSAVETPADLVDWVSLPVATVASQLVGGLSITLEGQEAKALASWSSSISVSPEILCRGVAARLSPGGGEPLGRISVFFDDAQFVELARAATVADLVTQQGQFEFEGSGSSIFETSGVGAQRFALVFGPTDRAKAESLRWQLLDAGRDSKLTFGEDHKGRPRPR